MSDRINQSYGQNGLSFVDRLGAGLSRRATLQELPKRADLEVLDLGCGFSATQLKALTPYLKRGVGVDLQLSADLTSLPKCNFFAGVIEEILPKLAGARFDAILLISVLEHLRDPLLVIRTARELLRPSAVLLINVPTWRGKTFLEFSAFRLGLSPKVEMDDHKMYYDKRDLWPLLIRGGFKPSLVKLRYHKFGLNLFAVARREDV